MQTSHTGNITGDSTRRYHDSDRLTPDNSVLVMIDHQTGLLSACRDIPSEQLQRNILALAKIGKAFGLPTILTQGGYGGENSGGPLLRELVELFPDVPIIDRHHVSAYDDPNFRAAITNRTEETDHGRLHDRRLPRFSRNERGGGRLRRVRRD